MNKPILSEAALIGLAGDFVRTIEPHTEADPAALAFQFIVAFGNLVGRRPYFEIEGTRHGTNLFLTVVGDSAKSRKGTSWNRVYSMISPIDPSWKERVLSGLSSGEGLIWQVRDPSIGKDADEVGIPDKRLLVTESEFASVLKIMNREGNILSTILRDAWDGKALNILTKAKAAKSKEPHISIIGHITLMELRRSLKVTEISNGFANRFLWTLAGRSKNLPFGGNLPEAGVREIQSKITKAFDFSQSIGKMQFTEETFHKWCTLYNQLNEVEYDGDMDSIASRSQPIVLRLACIYALLDCSQLVAPKHLDAASALWKYSEESARLIFEDTSGGFLARKVETILCSTNGSLSKSDLHRALGKYYSASKIDEALLFLEQKKRIGKEVIKPDGSTKPKTIWFSLGKQSEIPEFPELSKTSTKEVREIRGPLVLSSIIPNAKNQFDDPWSDSLTPI